jgi:hypothetical protein
MTEVTRELLKEISASIIFPRSLSIRKFNEIGCPTIRRNLRDITFDDFSPVGKNPFYHSPENGGNMFFRNVGNDIFTAVRTANPIQFLHSSIETISNRGITEDVLLIAALS